VSRRRTLRFFARIRTRLKACRPSVRSRWCQGVYSVKSRVWRQGEVRAAWSSLKLFMFAFVLDMLFFMCSWMSPRWLRASRMDLGIGKRDSQLDGLLEWFETKKFRRLSRTSRAVITYTKTFVLQADIKPGTTMAPNFSVSFFSWGAKINVCTHAPS
jgi:hypothetical protein